MAIPNIVKKLVTWKNFSSGRNAAILSFFVLLGFGLVYFSLPALAQSSTSTSGSASSVNTGIVSNNGIFSLDTVLNIFSNILSIIARYSLSLVMFVLSFIIEIASYNGYLNSVAVNNGWVLVRDLTNMIFVIALLAIAFGTILGIESYEWKKMLFKLISSAILVNFSRIICGILIDASQVVMMTFLNGIAATVGGNFIQAFNLTKIQSFQADLSGGNLSSASVFIAAMAACFVAVTILVVMCIMLAMLVARMIVLWVLIVLSPVAFVLSVLKKTEGYASEWWSEFGKNVITGPVLVFFIWLTLTTVGNGYVNQEIRANTSNASNPTTYNIGGVAEVLSGENLINFAIAIGMLLVGISVTKRLGGIGSDWAGKAVDYGKKVTFAASGLMTARAIARKGAEATVAGAKAGGKFVLQKAPLVGAEAWGRYGSAVKSGAVNKVIAPMTQWKNVKIGEMMKGSQEDKSIFKRTLKKVGVVAADAVTGSAYAKEIKDKRDETVKKAMEAAGRVKSTSSHPVSKNALYVDRRLERIKASGGSIKTSKETDEDLKYNEAQRIYEESLKSGGTKSEQKELRRRQLEELGYNSRQVADFERVDFARVGKATELKAETPQKQGIISESEKVRAQEHVEGLNKPVVISGSQTYSKGLTTDHVAGIATEDDFAKVLADSGVKDSAVINKMIDDFDAGKAVTVPITRELELDGSEESLAAATSVVDDLVRDEKQNKEMKNRLEYQNQDAKLANLAVQNQQLGKALGKMSDLDKVKSEERLRGSDEGYQAREQKIAGFTADLNQREERLTAQRQEDLLTEIRNLLENDDAYKNRQKEISEIKARESTARIPIEDQRVLEEAQAKSRVYLDAGDSLRAEAVMKAASSQISRRDTDLIAGLNYDERMAQEVLLTRRALEEEKLVDAGGPGAVDAKRRLMTVRRQKVALTAVNNRDNQTSQFSRLKAAEELGHNGVVDDVNSSDNRFVLELQRLTGSKKTDINELKKIFNEVYEGNEVLRQMALRSLSEAYKASAASGDMGGVGFIQSKIDSNNKQMFEWSENAQEANDKKKDLSQYYATQAKGQVYSVGAMSGNWKKIGNEWKFDGFTDENQDAVAASYSGMDAREVSQGKMGNSHNSWNNDAIVTKDNVENYVKTLQKIQSKMKEDGFNALMIYTKKFVKNLDDAYQDLAKADPKKAAQIEVQIKDFVAKSQSTKKGKKDDVPTPESGSKGASSRGSRGDGWSDGGRRRPATGSPPNVT